MKAVMPQLKGEADGRSIRQVVLEELKPARRRGSRRNFRRRAR